METVFRKEIKYLISRGEAMILQQKLDSIMERDIHGENGRYFIRSQYYDSIDDQDLWDNLDLAPSILAAPMISGTPSINASEVILIRLMMSLKSGGNATRTACGITILVTS